MKRINKHTVTLVGVGSLLLAAAAGATRQQPETVLQTVRGATSQYLNVNVPLHNGEGWVVGTPCVSGPDFGAMGVHLVLPTRIGASAKLEEPEALIYEPQSNGAMRLVGVEYIVDAAAWGNLHKSDGAVPQVAGNLMNYVPFPNRFGLQAFYELHIWAWERNPQGAFADWNTSVTCEKQPPQEE